MANYMLVDAEKLDNDISNLAHKIRAKAGTDGELDWPEGFEAAVDGIGGGDITKELENIIDQSEVLDSIDGTVTVTEKVEQLIDKADVEKFYFQKTSIITNASAWFKDFNGEKLPRSNFVKATNVTSFANRSTITDVDYYLNWGAESNVAINATSAFAETANLTHMVGARTEQCYNMTNFLANSAIEEVDEPFNLSSITQRSYLSSAFNCSKLREVRFAEESIKWSITFSSTVLSVDSAKSIILGLKNYSEDNDNMFAHTLKLPDEVWAKLENEPDIVVGNVSYTWTEYVDMVACWNR